MTGIIRHTYQRLAMISRTEPDSYRSPIPPATHYVRFESWTGMDVSTAVKTHCFVLDLRPSMHASPVTPVATRLNLGNRAGVPCFDALTIKRAI